MPIMQYPTTSSKTGEISYQESRNILVRAKILETVKSNMSTALSYRIKDGERPEHIARRVYGRSDLHWVILMFNETLDPYFRWPISSNELDAVVANRYAGKAYFVDSKNPIQGSKDFWFEVGTEITVSYTYKGLTKSFTTTISEWEPDLYKIVVPSDVQTFTFSTGYTATITQTRSDGYIVSAPLMRVVDDNRYAAHHFIYQDSQETADHHILLNDPNLASEAIGESASVIDRYIRGADVIPLSVSTIIPVTNYTFEVESNDAKRIINVMRPQYVQMMIREMRSQFLG